MVEEVKTDFEQTLALQNRQGKQMIQTIEQLRQRIIELEAERDTERRAHQAEAKFHRWGEARKMLAAAARKVAELHRLLDRQDAAFAEERSRNDAQARMIEGLRATIKELMKEIKELKK